MSQCIIGSVVNNACLLFLHFHFCHSGMLSHAVMPPNYEHVYAQWRERDSCNKALDGNMQLTGRHGDVKVGEEEDLSAHLANMQKGHFMDMRALRMNLKGK